MNLRQQAELDLATILEDGVRGFGWPITVKDPSGAVASLVGRSSDIASLIDPDTGQVVSGRLATVTLRLSSLALGGLGQPRSVAEEDCNPWTVTFDDVLGEPHTFRVVDAHPDLTVGLVTCYLGVLA